MDKLNPLMLILGSNGQIGSALSKVCAKKNLAFVTLNRSQIDLCRERDLREKLNQLRPGIILNAAAFTAVDLAETDLARNQQLNHQLPFILAQWCAESRAKLVHYSSDYVYSGAGDGPWSEEDPCTPLNAYGRAKLAGDRAIREAGCDHFILRTSWVYSVGGKNFLNTMLELGQQREQLQVVDDQFGSPSYALDLATATLHALLDGAQRRVFPSGVYHLTNAGWTTWWEFAKTIFDILDERGIPHRVRELVKIDSTQLVRPALRPKNSRLNCRKFIDTFAYPLPHWREALARCLAFKFGG